MVELKLIGRVNTVQLPSLTTRLAYTFCAIFPVSFWIPLALPDYQCASAHWPRSTQRTYLYSYFSRSV